MDDTILTKPSRDVVRAAGPGLKISDSAVAGARHYIQKEVRTRDLLQISGLLETFAVDRLAENSG